MATEAGNDGSNPMKAQADMLEKVLRKKKESSWKVVELKLFLIARGVSDAGKKAALVERLVQRGQGSL